MFDRTEIGTGDFGDCGIVSWVADRKRSSGTHVGVDWFRIVGFEFGSGFWVWNLD